MTRALTVSIDAMGGDAGPGVVVSALGYGLIGVLIGVPLAATINLYRSARHFLIPVVLVVLFLAYEFGLLRLH